MPSPCVGGDRHRLAEAELVEIRRGHVRVERLGLVDDHEHRLAGAAQDVGHVQVRGRAALRAHRRGTARGRPPRTAFRVCSAISRSTPCDRLDEAAGVDDHAAALADARVAVLAVAGQAGHVGDQRVARARERVEQRRLADVGAPDQRDDGKHGQRPAAASGAERGDLAAVVDDEQPVADHDRCRRDARAARALARHEPAGAAVEPVQVAVEVADHDRAAVHGRRAEPAALQALLLPDRAAVATAHRDHVAVGGRDVQLVVVEGDATIARQVARPPDLAAVERDHRDAALVADRVDLLARDAHRGVDVRKALEFRAAARRATCACQRISPLASVTAITRPESKPLITTSPARDRRRRAAQRQPRHDVLDHPGFLAVGRVQRAQPSVHRAHDHPVACHQRRGEHFAAARAPPSAACRSRRRVR